MKSAWALITGASSGIGLGVARQLASENYNLVLAARRQERLDSLAHELQKANKIEIQTFSLDVRQNQRVEQFAEQVKVPIHALINNAGLALGIDKMAVANVSDWDAMVDTNVKGLLYVTRAFLPRLLQQDFADIINLGSVAGRWVYPGGAVYCASKFAVRALSEGLRMDVHGSNIRVINIEPGLVETEFSKVRLQNDDKAKAVYQGFTPLNPEDIAQAVSWTIGRPRHVNIQEMVIYPTAQAAPHMVHRNN